MNTDTTELGNSVREEVRRILKRFEGQDIAGVRMTTIRAIDALLNPVADGYEINTARCDARPYELMTAAAVERMQEQGQ